MCPPSRGSILIGGRDVTALPAAKRNIGIVFQSYALFPHLDVFGNVAFPLSLRGLGRDEIRTRVEEVLGLVRLTGLDKRRPHQLSGGQQQRVALARALVFGPDILLLDEPLAALDRKLREEVRQEIHRVQRRLGITTIMVTHDQDEALSLSDRIVVLNHGRVEQFDTPDTMYRRPRTRFVADFLGTANFIEGWSSENGSRAVIRLASGREIACPEPVGGSSRVVAMIRPDGIRIVSADGAGVLPGVVEERVFFGETIRYVVALEDGGRMSVHARAADERIQAGAAVGLAWEPASVWVIPETG